MLQDLVNPLEQEQLAMEKALTTSSPIASHLLDFSAVDLFSEALLSTSDDISSSNPAAVATNPSVHSCSYEDASFVSAALSMDPDTLSSILDSRPPNPKPDGYPVPILQVIQQDQFDQIVSDGFSMAAYSVGAIPLPAYDDECLMPARVASYVGMEDPVIDRLMYQGGMDGGGMDGGDEGFFPAMVGPVKPGMRLQEVAEYQNRIQYGMDQLQYVYSSNPADLQVFGDCRQQLVRTCSSPTPVTDLPSLDESTFKVGRLSAEERKEKIHRYMKKRNERNFSKKIKYACRKTLADSRPRVRGRFAKNKESGEIARPSSSHMEYDDDEEVMVKEEDIFDPSDILRHINGVNSFKYNYTLESWI